jgi:hypothetical protein
MAAPTLPTLTWQRSAVQTVTTATTSEVLAAIEVAISASSYWIVKTHSTAAAAAVDYLEIAPRMLVEAGHSASNVQPAMQAQRIIIAGRGSGNLSAGSMGQAQSSNNQIPVPGTDALVMNYAPEGGSGSSTPTVDSFYPYGHALSRATGYYGVADDIDGSNTFNVWLIESAEILTVCIENTSDNESGFGFVAGPILRPPTTGSNDCDVENRIYGALTFGTDFGAEMWENLTTGWSDSTTDGVGAYKAVAFDPVSDTTSSGCKLLSLTRFEEITNNSTQFLVSGDGAYIGLPFNYYSTNWKGSGSMEPNRYIGVARQMRMIRDFPARIIIQDGAGNTVGFGWSSHPTTPYDAVGFTNE